MSENLIQGEAGEVVKRLNDPGLIPQANGLAASLAVVAEAADLITRQANRLKEAREVIEGLMHFEIAHVGPYAGQRVAAVRAWLDKESNHK